MNDTTFSNGSIVRRRSAPDQVGVVRQIVHNEQVGDLCRVQFGTQTRTVPLHDLEPLPNEIDPWTDLLAGRVEGASTFQRLMTFERLHRPPSRVATTFGTARAKLFPYQFKPLLKFLDNSTQRLLIADDVGLGKTVEAGYILKELKARHELERVLIVVPARLKNKWKNELSSRFDERFDCVSAKDVVSRLIEPLRRGADLPYFLWIASYESLRRPEITSPLAELQPPMDLVIMDEAHKVRNSETQQHALARALSHAAAAMLLLTATPIQTSREDLFQLLRMLDPVTFARYDVFEKQLDANRPLVRALSAIRGNPPRIADAREQLLRLRRDRLTAALTNGRFFASLLERLHPAAIRDRAALVDLQRDMSELSLTSHVLTRTRRVDVLPDRPQRRATALRVDLTPAERRAYDAIGAVALLANPASGWGAVMAAMTAVRYAASCLPAALDYFRNKFGQTLDTLLRDVDEDSADENDAKSTGVTTTDFWAGLKTDIASDPTVDTKFRCLREALDRLWTEDHSAGRNARKVIIFSFFRGTLRYLAEQLNELDVRVRVIHGLVPTTERERLIDEFLTQSNIRILLSSEVGSEGIDLQQASVIINYDLPWNPMVVEQRIGRIDRLGQESTILTILSLVLSNTIEDQILYRLYDRIGLFEDSIGEIEPILGTMVEKLAVAALRNELSAAELKQQADHTVDAFLNEQRQGSTLQRNADQLIAGDQAFLDEVESLIGDRKVPSPSELHRFLDEFISRRYPGSAVPVGALDGIGEMALGSQVATDLRQELHDAADVRRVASRVEHGLFLATFDADCHLRRPRSELISIHHPLMRLACSSVNDRADALHRAFRLRVRVSDSGLAGDYLLAVLEFTIRGSQVRWEILPVVWDIQRRQPLSSDESRHILVELLDVAENAEDFDSFITEQIESAIFNLKEHLHGVHAEMNRRETTLHAVRAERRRATQRATLDARVRAAQQRLEGLTSRHAAPFAIRMADATLKKEQRRLGAFDHAIDGEASISIDERMIAVSLVSVYQPADDSRD